MAQNNYDNWTIQLSRWMLDNVLFLSNLNLYEIYKLHHPTSTHQTTTTQRHQTTRTSLQNKSIDWHKRSRICYLVASTLVTYFLAKTSIINIVHLSLHKINHGMGNCPHWWSTCQETLLIIRARLGDPMSELGAGMILFTWALATGTFLFIAFMPYYFRSYTLDLASLRFYYEPQRELDRIDRMIDHRLNGLLDSMLNYHRNNISSSRGGEPTIDYTNWKSTQCVYQQLMRHKSEGFQRLRPIYFQESSRLVALREAAWLFIAFYLVYFIFATILTGPTIILTAGTKCEAMGLPECNLQTAFTRQEVIYLLELLTICFISYISFTFHTIVVLIQLKSNSRLVANMETHLLSCLRRLRGYNATRRSARPTTYSRCEHERVEKSLFKNFVKILVSCGELRRGAGSMTHLLLPWFVQAFLLVCLFVLVDWVSSEATRALERQILIAYWIMLNTLALICAAISSRATQLQRLYWSIHAELIVYHQSLSMDGSFISLVWQKLSDYSRSISHLYAARPFKVALTYRKIIEINFSIISVVSFLLLSQLATRSSSASVKV